MYGCKLLIRTDNSLIIIDIPCTGGWTGLARVARYDEGLTSSPGGDFSYLSSHNHQYKESTCKFQDLIMC